MRIISSLLLILFGFACGAPESDSPDAGSDGLLITPDAGSDVDADLDTAEEADAEVPIRLCEEVGLLDTLAGSEPGVVIELWRLQNPDGGCAYLAFLPHPDASPTSPRPVVITTRPYAGIDWTGEALDARWAGREGASTGYRHADEDEPSVTETSGDIGFTLTPAAALEEEAGLYRYNGLSAAFAYGRFYAGGDLNNDKADIAAGIDYVSSRPEVDPAHVGVFGMSWGGFEALYGSATATSTPAVTVAHSPPIDFSVLTDWAGGGCAEATPSRAALCGDFFDPYLRRIRAVVGDDLSDRGAFGLYNAETLCGVLPSTLILHDSWDMLVPFEGTLDFAQRCERVNPLYEAHSGPFDPTTAIFDHAGGGLPDGYPASLTFALAFLLTGVMAEAPIVVPFEDATLRGFLQNLRALPSSETYAVTAAAPRLAELMADNVSLFDVADETIVDGGETLTSLVNEVWETSLTEGEIRILLESGAVPQ